VSRVGNVRRYGFACEKKEETCDLLSDLRQELRAELQLEAVTEETNQMPQPKSTTYTEQVSRQIIDMEHLALVRWCQGDPWGFLDICAPDVVYFDPYTERRISRLKGRVSLVHYELINPKVQLVGNAAVLTFNYLSRDASGAEECWNCTEVYRHDGRALGVGHWQLTHMVIPVARSRPAFARLRPMPLSSQRFQQHPIPRRLFVAPELPPVAPHALPGGLAGEGGGGEDLPAEVDEAVFADARLEPLAFVLRAEGHPGLHVAREDRLSAVGGCAGRAPVGMHHGSGQLWTASCAAYDLNLSASISTVMEPALT